MDRNEAEAYALRWAEDWNRRDLAAVLSHFSDEVEFSSPLAQHFLGTPTVRGKRALEAYWRTALAPVASLHFTVVRILWDGATSELAIVYDRVADGQPARVAEVLRFGADGLVVGGEVFGGVVPAAA